MLHNQGGVDMGKIIDLTGKTFGRLTVMALSEPPKPTKYKALYWLCRCDCGNQTIVSGGNLSSGKIKSCGCLRKELTEKNKKHGMCDTRLYHIYQAMKARCFNANHNKYKNYGGRGISICCEWLGENGFQTFAEWSMSNGYSDELSIDRIDVNKGYSPENCRWTNSTIQNFNRRNRSINKTGHTGVMKRPNGKYVVQIPINKKPKHVGIYTTLEEAIEARERAKRKLYPELFTEEST